MSVGYTPPPFPYDRLDQYKTLAEEHDGGPVDLSIGTPCDPPPPAALRALAHSDAERGYPPSIGTPEFRGAAARWMERRLGVSVDPGAGVAATIGTKEFVAGVPHWLHLRRPDLDTVLYPEISYPSYAMGAELAGLRSVPVALDEAGRIRLDTISADDIGRALCLWVNSPGNPAGNLDDLGAAAVWGRANDVLVLSDECYVEFTWRGERRTILEHGTEGLVAVHSLSKRSNLAGTRAGFYAGDPEIVGFIREIRKHAGFMVPGPVQAAATVALDDDEHVEHQKDIYRQRLELGARMLDKLGVSAEMPGGGFYLWARVGDAWAFTERMAAQAGVLVSPGEFYGLAGTDHVRIAMVQPDDRMALAASRLGIEF
ncbi:MAG: aminotransferase class I/II-fold pyridoxal phosphate-dependent enzyme [Actinomycetia bacterium]|nr:aminotransferase class I/II-fold pyridoxal phosphate-dependent enzyme [Actinomycetes bacterium]